MTILFLILSCLTLADIQANYYSGDSFRIASASPEELCMEGDSLNVALNRIARANYKHANYRRGLRFAGMVEYEGFEKLRLNTLSLKALLNQNIGNITTADSLYHVLLQADLQSHIAYEVHLNYAELMRLNMDYERREQHLLMALSYADGWERNKTIRVLARHYFNILCDYDSARQIIKQHDPMHKLTPEGKAGWMLLQAQLAEAEQSYERARDYYNRANVIARKAGFMGFSYQAVDGYMRTTVQMENSIDEMLLYLLVGSMALGFLLYNIQRLKVYD